MPSIQVSDATYRAIELAARMAKTSPGTIVERLVEQQTAEAAHPVPVHSDASGSRVLAIYNGTKVTGVFDPETSSITITSGSLSSTRYKSPSAAARAVIENEKPGVDANRNGWTFWTLDDGSGRDLRSIRP